MSQGKSVVNFDLIIIKNKPGNVPPEEQQPSIEVLSSLVAAPWLHTQWLDLKSHIPQFWQEQEFMTTANGEIESLTPMQVQQRQMMKLWTVVSGFAIPYFALRTTPSSDLWLAWLTVFNFSFVCFPSYVCQVRPQLKKYQWIMAILLWIAISLACGFFSKWSRATVNEGNIKVTEIHRGWLRTNLIE